MVETFKIGKSIEAKELPQNMSIFLPASVELFLSGTQQEAHLPQSIAENPDLIRQATQRRNLYAGLGRVFMQIADVNMDISEAVTKDMVSVSDVTLMYQELTDFLEDDPNNARIILYLPFQLLPFKDRQRKPDALGQAQEGFVKAYTNGWRRMLREDDVRANFVDGDILEPSLSSGMPPLVKKAAHLIPELVERGIVTMQEVIGLLQDDDGVLVESVLSTLPVIADSKNISRNDWNNMLFSSNNTLIDAALITSHTLEIGTQLQPEETERIFQLFLPSQFENLGNDDMYEVLEKRFNQVHTLLKRNMLSSDDVTKVSHMMLSGMKFWSMNAGLTALAIQVAEHMPESVLGKALRSKDTFAIYSDVDEVRAWAHKWDRKPKTELQSVEVMNTTDAWKRIEQAKTSVKPKPDEKLTKKWFEALPESVKFELDNITRVYDLEDRRGVIPKERLSWERIDKRLQVISRSAKDAATALRMGIVGKEDVRALCERTDEKGEYQLIGIKAIAEVVEGLGRTNTTQAQQLATHFEDVFVNAWNTGSLEVKDAVSNAWYHWAGLGVIEKSFAEKFGLSFPEMDAVFPVDLDNLLQNQLQGIDAVVEGIDNGEVYPVFLLFGSQFKGYANKNADVDVASFVKPGVSWSDRKRVVGEVNNLLKDKEGLGKVVEFWLANKGDGLEVADVPLVENAIAEKNWVHVMLGSMWYGKKEDVDRLYKELIPQYVEDTSMPYELHEDRRAFFLREIERDVLQYRLMHKGYARYYPRRGGIGSEHGEGVDSQSDFWDPGFRRVATRLFLSKVFLPKVRS